MGVGIPAIGLTTISGGINRLRVKGGVDKNSLYDLLNGYVTQANTVKVRPGTFRNANIATLSGAGTTKGLVAYQGDLHVFSNAIVPVPAGYDLHVLNHPAQQQTITNPGINVTTVITAGQSGGGGTPFVGNWWEQNGFGFSAAAPSPPFTVAGAASVTNIAGQTLGALAAANSGGPFNPSLGTPCLIISLSAGLAQSFFTSVTVTKAGGSPQTFNTASATRFNPAATGTGDLTGTTTWVWTIGSVAALFANGVQTTVQFNAAGASTSTNNPIPIKEIHFAAPYLGGIYVVAEYNVTDPVVLAQYGSVFHYWVQSSTGGDNTNEWVANTDFQIGDIIIPTAPNGLTYVASRRLPANPVWSPNTGESIGNVVEPVIANGFQYTVTAVLGATPTTGATEPTWPTSDGATVNENSALAVDQTITLAVPATAAPTPVIPARYAGSIAGGFGVKL